MNIKLTLGRRVKPAAALPRAFGFGKSMGLLSGVICVIALFSLLQLFSTLFISNILRDAKVNLVTGDALHRQQATMDRARLSLLTASDTLNRAGIYYLQDKATGSEGSWHSLLDESLAALAASKQAFARFERLSAAAPEATGALKDSYRLFYDGLKEQAQGLQSSASVDAFFAVPIQAFQADFNEKYLAYQTLNERRWAAGGRQSPVDGAVGEAGRRTAVGDRARAAAGGAGGRKRPIRAAGQPTNRTSPAVRRRR